MSFGSDLHTILVATDGSQSAVDAVEFAVELAAERDATLLVVHVVRTLEYVNDDPEEEGYAVPHVPSARDQAVLDDAAARAAERGVVATTSLRLGSTVEEILAYAEACNVDVIVVGTRGHGRVASALLGSVSLGVLHKATRPVLIVRGAPSTTSTANPRRRSTTA
jgi:nucleotide-binding universal stress UspA family protein